MRKTLTEIFVFLYVCLFLYTGIGKLLNYEMSREQMAVMPLVGGISGFVTWFLPVFEIILSIMIFIPMTRKVGMTLGTLLMAAFTIYVAYIMKYNSHLPCTCGGFLQELSWPQHLAFNGAFVIFGILSLRFSRPKEKTKIPTLKFSN
jgi:uncharacterized membrane protein YphA (DoxX/SURF4 family)